MKFCKIPRLVLHWGNTQQKCHSAENFIETEKCPRVTFSQVFPNIISINCDLFLYTFVRLLQ